MNVEIINVGTELLLGEIVNTNATWLQRFCKELGFDVYHQSVVGDNPERFKECLQIAFGRGADCVITTGGLGPTPDDLTKELSAEFLGIPLAFIEEEAQKVEAKCRFLTGYDRVPENNFKQAWFPEGCYVLENEVGTANGCVMQKDGRMIVNLPGPPKEMTYVAERELYPYLLPYKKDVIYTKDIVTVGLGESNIAMRLAELIDAQKEVTVALYASETTVRVRLGCKASDEAAAHAQMKPVAEQIEKMLADYLVPQANMTEALAAILPPFRVDYQSEFRFRPEFLLSRPTGGELIITVETEAFPLGEKLHLTFARNGKTDRCSIGLLKKAELNPSRLESRVVNRLYSFLRAF